MCRCIMDVDDVNDVNDVLDDGAEAVGSPNATDEMLERTCLLDLNDAYSLSSVRKRE